MLETVNSKAKSCNEYAGQTRVSKPQPGRHYSEDHQGMGSSRQRANRGLPHVVGPRHLTLRCAATLPRDSLSRRENGACYLSGRQGGAEGNHLAPET